MRVSEKGKLCGLFIPSVCVYFSNVPLRVRVFMRRSTSVQLLRESNSVSANSLGSDARTATKQTKILKKTTTKKHIETGILNMLFKPLKQKEGELTLSMHELRPLAYSAPLAS